MRNIDQNTLFNVALVAMAREIGAKKAIQNFLLVLDEKVEMNYANDIIVGFFKEVGIDPGIYDKRTQSYANESKLIEAMAIKLQATSRSQRII